MRITRAVLDDKITEVAELAASRGIRYVDRLGQFPVANMYIYTAYGYPTLVARIEEGSAVTNDICTARDNRGIYQWLKGYARALYLLPEITN